MNEVKKREEMETYFLTRTMDHIHRVQKNALVLVTKYAEVLGFNDDIDSHIYKKEFMRNIMRHDLSKFSANQYEEYLMFSWKKKHGLKLSNVEQSVFDAAWKNHYEVENHHPEDLNYSFTKHGYNNYAYCGAKWRTRLSLFECACDLQAMAEEFGEGDFEKYYKTKWVIKHKEPMNKVGYSFEAVKKTMEKVLECFKHHIYVTDYGFDDIKPLDK